MRILARFVFLVGVLFLFLGAVICGMDEGLALILAFLSAICLLLEKILRDKPNVTVHHVFHIINMSDGTEYIKE